MKPLNRILACAITFALLIGFTPSAGAEASEISKQYVLAVEMNLLPDSMLYDSNLGSPVSRLEFAQMTALVVEKKTGVRISEFGKDYYSHIASFSDTSDKSVIQTARLGLIGGYNDGTFKPNNAITRESAAVVLYKTARLFGFGKTSEKSNYFDRSRISGWAAEGVDFGSAYGLMQPVSPGTFNPRGILTRADAIKGGLELYQRLKAFGGSDASKFWAVHTEKELVSIARSAEACLLTDSGKWAESFSSPADITSEGLFNCFLSRELRPEWYDSKDGLFRIPASEVNTALGKYFEKFSFAPDKLPGYSQYTKTIIRATPAQFTWPKILGVSLVSAESNILRLEVTCFAQPPSSVGVVCKRLLCLAAGQRDSGGFKLLSYTPLYDYGALYSLKTAALKGDSDSRRLVEDAVSLLLLPRINKVKKLDIDLSGAPGLDIRLDLPLKSGEAYAVPYTYAMRDAAVLFALFPNLSDVTISFECGEYALVHRISRAQAKGLLGTDASAYVSSQQAFTAQFPQKLNRLVYEPDVKSVISYDFDVATS